MSGSTMRSNVNLTASALNGVPSWKVTPSRSWKVYSVASSLTLQAVARPGANSPGDVCHTSGSTTWSVIRPTRVNVVRFGSTWSKLPPMPYVTVWARAAGTRARIVNRAAKLRRRRFMETPSRDGWGRLDVDSDSVRCEASRRFGRSDHPLPRWRASKLETRLRKSYAGTIHVVKESSPRSGSGPEALLAYIRLCRVRDRDIVKTANHGVISCAKRLFRVNPDGRSPPCPT